MGRETGIDDQNTSALMQPVSAHFLIFFIQDKHFYVSCCTLSARNPTKYRQHNSTLRQHRLPVHLIKPLGFDWNNKQQLRRAGLDYHQWAEVKLYDNYQHYCAESENILSPPATYALTTKGSKTIANPALRLATDLCSAQKPEAYRRTFWTQHPEISTLTHSNVGQ